MAGYGQSQWGGGFWGDQAGGIAPANTVQPLAYGSPVVGQTLSTLDGTWTGDAPITFTYRWMRDAHGNYVYIDVPANNGVNYLILDGDDGCHVSCFVTATNAAGAVVSGSNPLFVTEPVAVNTITPMVTGSTSPGSTLTADHGTWDHTGGYNVTYAYQWQRDDVDIGGSTNQTWTVLDGDGGHSLRCRITVTNTGGTASATSTEIGIPVPPSGVVGVGQMYTGVEFSTQNVGNNIRDVDGELVKA